MSCERAKSVNAHSGSWSMWPRLRKSTFTVLVDSWNIARGEPVVWLTHSLLCSSASPLVKGVTTSITQRNWGSKQGDAGRRAHCLARRRYHVPPDCGGLRPSWPQSWRLDLNLWSFPDLKVRAYLWSVIKRQWRGLKAQKICQTRTGSGLSPFGIFYSKATVH